MAGSRSQVGAAEPATSNLQPATRNPSGGYVGRPLRRIEDRPLLTGSGCYVEDIQLPGMLALAILRSPYPHARIAGVRTEAARRAPGVVDVVDGRETAHLTHLTVNRFAPEMRVPLHRPLALDTVRYVGDEVAAVLADDRYRARDALDLIEVEYEPLPGVSDVEVGVADGAPLVHEEFGSNVVYSQSYGSGPDEVEAAFARADHVVSLRIKNGRLAPVAIEPRVVLADWNADARQLRVWAGTQRPFFVRDELAAALGLDAAQVRVVAPDVGGAFGSKGAHYREELLVAYLAMKHGRTVRWSATRSEDLATSMQARDQVHLVDAAFSRQGDLLALRAWVYSNLGAYLHAGTGGPPTRTARLICGAYRVPVARSELTTAFTNTAPTGPYRGAGRPEAAFLIERVMDTAARELGLDPLEIRRRNYIRPDEFPWQTPTGLTYDSGDYEHTLDHALGVADYERLVALRDETRAKGGLFGIGLATFIEPSGSANGESGRVRVEPSGRVVAATGSSAHGQGHETTFAQVVADRLGVAFEQVAVVRSDTAAVPKGIGTFASRSTALGGSALARAADAVLEQMRRVAGHLLEVDPADVVYEDGVFRPAGVGSQDLSFAQVAAAAHDPGRLPAGMEPGLEATDWFSPPDESYSHGAHIAAVELDPETGRPRLHTFVAVDDAGVIVNPLLAQAQVHGGLAQGIGQALLEGVVYDEDGTLLTGTLGDYAVPRAGDLPPFRLGETVTPSPLNPLGAKGVGEGGTVGAPPAVVNAVVDALSPRVEGAQHLDMPLTAERVWRFLRRSGG